MAALSAVGPAWGQERAADLQRALDQPVNLTVKDTTIAQVFEELQSQTKVQFVVTPETYEFLPYGQQTRLDVTLKNVTLRKALGPMLASQALQWVARGDAVQVLPSDALFRLCRRATYEEQRLLGAIHTARLQPAGPDELLAQLRQAAGVEALRIDWSRTGVDDTARRAMYDRAAEALPGPAAAWLDALAAAGEMSWHLQGETVVLLDRKAQVQRQLGRNVSLKYRNADLSAVLLELAHQAHLKLTMAPGVMALVAPQTRENFNLVMAEASIAEALEAISGATGLVFLRTEEGIHVEASPALQAALPAGGQDRRRPPFFLRLTVPVNGVDVEVFLRGDDLPEDLIEAIEARKAALVEQLRKQLLPEGAGQ